jgi:ribosome-binding protein aMBF1 (putative translation factor)
MKNKLMYAFDDHLKESLKRPGFRKAWKESETEYALAKQIIEKRLAKKMSQRELAIKLKTSQAAISRVENMGGNPSLDFLKRLAHGLGTTFSLQIQ